MSKGHEPHDSLVRAGDKLARCLERRYDFLKRIGPDGFRASGPVLRALANWRTISERHRVSPTPKGKGMKKAAALFALLLSLLPTLAHATGLPAPEQARFDAAAICEGPVGPMALDKVDDDGSLLASGYCIWNGRTVQVVWFCAPTVGRRWVLVPGREGGWFEVTHYPPAMVLRDRGLCE